MSNITYNTTNITNFSPTSITGCSLWLDAADGSTITYSSGTSVQQWRDKSTNALIMSNGTQSNQPTVTNTLASKNVLGFTTVQNLTTTSNLTLGPAQSMFIVFNSLTNGNYFFMEHGPNTNTTNGSYLYGSNADLYAINRGGTIRFVDNPPRSTPPFTSNTWFIVSFVNTNTSTSTDDIYFRINGSNRSIVYDRSPASNAVLTSNATDLFYLNPSGRVPASNLYAEILVYNAALTSLEAQQVEGYLAWKWGLQTSLPIGHPYKNIPTYTLTTTNEFNPTYLASCQFWYDANDLATITLSGSNVTNWNDKSGNGRNLARFTTPGPFLTSNFNGSYRTVQAISNSNGTIEVLSVPSGAMQGDTGSSFFVVLNYDSPSGGGVIALYNEPRFLCLEGPSRYDYGPLGSNVVYYLPSGYSYCNAQIFGQTLDLGTNTLRVFQTGSELSNVVVTPITISYTKSFGFWGIPESGLVPGYGKLSEFIGYNRFLSTAERQQVEGYLAWKWGLQGSLPSTHPYKNQPVYFFSPTFPQTSIPVGLRPITFNNPQDIATLEYWFDASDPSTISRSGTSLTGWTNKGTAGSNGNISVGAGTPTTEVASQNRLNCIGLPAGSSLTFTSQFSNQPRTRFIATRPTVNTTTTAVVLMYQGGESINGYDYIGLEGSSGAVEVAQGQIVNLQTNAMPQHQNTFYIYTFLNGATAARNRIAFTGAPQTLSTDIAANQYFGGSVTTYINNDLNAISSSAQEIGEILSYNSELPLHETQIVEGYLAWKWGAQASLPLNHPFRLFPPPPYVIPPSPPPPPPPPFSGWSIVLDGADASVNDNGGGSYTCNGPNDSGGSGWAYIYGFFSSAGSITYNYDFATFDGIFYDWPFEYVTSNDPSNPANVDFNTKIASNSFESGTRTVNYGANQYVVLGVYSIDSIFGNGVCTFSGLPT